MFNEDPITDSDNIDIENKEKLIYRKTYVANKYYIHLDEDIGAPEQYRSVCLVLKECSENKKWYFYKINQKSCLYIK